VNFKSQRIFSYFVTRSSFSLPLYARRAPLSHGVFPRCIWCNVFSISSSFSYLSSYDRREESLFWLSTRICIHDDLLFTMILINRGTLLVIVIAPQLDELSASRIWIASSAISASVLIILRDCISWTWARRYLKYKVKYILLFDFRVSIGPQVFSCTDNLRI